MSLTSGFITGLLWVGSEGIPSPIFWTSSFSYVPHNSPLPFIDIWDTWSMTAFLSLPPVSMPVFPGTAGIHYFKSDNRTNLPGLCEQIMVRILHRLTVHLRLKHWTHYLDSRSRELWWHWEQNSLALRWLNWSLEGCLSKRDLLLVQGNENNKDCSEFS